MFKIMRLFENAGNRKSWYCESDDSWGPDFYLGTVYHDIHECLSKLRELSYDLERPLYVSVMMDY